MKLYYGKNIKEKEYIGNFSSDGEASKAMRLFLYKKDFDPWYWRMWYSEDGSYRTYDFGSWSYFFFLYNG